MKWSETPSLNSLRAFGEVAATGSFSDAAAALNVTQAAVSQQVRQLEARLGVSLVVRAGRGIRLTDAGAILARDVGQGFEIVRQGVARVVSEQAEQPVHVTMSPAFASEWLMPRLAGFQAAHPEVLLMLNPTAKVMDLRPGGIDVAIRYCDRRRPLDSARLVLETDMIVAATPSLAEKLQPVRPAALANAPWLQELGTNEAADWLTFHGVAPQAPLNVMQMPGGLVMNAVRRGDGVTYTARAFFQREIEAGQMAVLHSDTGFGRYVIEALPEPRRGPVQVFIDWLLDNAERCVMADQSKT